MVPPDTSSALGTAPAWDTPDRTLERGFSTATALVLLVLKQHWEEIFSYSEEPCLIICVAFLMNYKELLLLAKHVPDAMPQAGFFWVF